MKYDTSTTIGEFRARGYLSARTANILREWNGCDQQECTLDDLIKKGICKAEILKIRGAGASTLVEVKNMFYAAERSLL